MNFTARTDKTFKRLYLIFSDPLIWVSSIRHNSPARQINLPSEIIIKRRVSNMLIFMVLILYERLRYQKGSSFAKTSLEISSTFRHDEHAFIKLDEIKRQKKPFQKEELLWYIIWLLIKPCGLLLMGKHQHMYHNLYTC